MHHWINGKVNNLNGQLSIFFFPIKDTRDVPQFDIHVIFFDILFLIYLQLNLLIPKNSVYIICTRLLSELEYLEFFLK